MGTNGGIVSFAFDFGDGTNTDSPASKVTHSYPAFGIYPVAVTVTDELGLSASMYKQLCLVQLALLQNRPACGCAKMTLNAKTGATYTLTDNRRPDGKGGWNLAVMGPDQLYLSYNFEISTDLTKDSDATKCTEGQQFKATYSLPAPGQDKSACSAGRTTVSPCQNNAQCATHACKGGVLDGKTCNNSIEATRCLIGGGRCMSNNDGTCTKYPFSGAARRYDDYQAPYPDPGTIKLHVPPTGRPVWNDFPGRSGQTQANIGQDYRMDADFFSFLNGPGGNCSCHFTVVLDWDNTNKKYRPATSIKLANDAETVNCVIDQ
jgi:PKD repeat protein